MAAASRSLGRLMPATSPATYAILTLSCLIYVVTLALNDSTAADLEVSVAASSISERSAGKSSSVWAHRYRWPVDLAQPWRFVTAVFLHGSLLHIFFNMWVLMDIGPQIEELYGSARYLFIYVVAGIGGYVVSSAFWHFSVGGSGALLGLIGVLLAMTVGRRTAGMQMLRSQLIRWLIYIGIWGLLFPGIDNWAHAGGLATGFILGKIMADRPPATPEEQKLAYALGWAAALVIVASFAMVALGILRRG